jgi:hypothetical protein
MEAGMLIICDEQVEVFEQHLFDAMQQRVERAIAAVFPEFCDKPAAGGTDGAAAGAGQIGTIVERGIESAANYGMAEAPDFAAFIALGLALRLTPPGPAGDWIYPYVNRANTPGPTRLRMIESRLQSLAEDHPALALIAQRMAKAREGAAG